MWYDDFDEDGVRRSQRRPEPNNNDGRLIAVGLIAAAALFFASAMPAPLMPPVFSELLFFAAMGYAAVALFRSDRLGADVLTAWDQAALLLFLSLLSGLFVDPEAVAQAIEQAQTAAAGV